MLCESRTRKLGGLRVTVQLNLQYLWLDVPTHNAQYLKPLIERVEILCACAFTGSLSLPKQLQVKQCR
jgi:hypothetical protein